MVQALSSRGTGVLVVVQARTGSTRLPGKVLAELGGAPMLWRVVERARRIRGAERVAVATSELARDDAVAALCSERDVDCVRGSESDVLSRFALAARRFEAKTIVRVTADCPLLGWEEAGRTLALHLARGNHYTHNLTCYGSGMPLGTGIEVMSREALEISQAEAREPEHREHVCEFLYAHPERFRVQMLEAGARCEAPQLRLTVDTAADLAFMRALYRERCLLDAGLALEDVVDWCARRGWRGAEPLLKAG